VPNLVFVRLAGARTRIGEIFTPGVYFLPFLLAYLANIYVVVVRPSVCRLSVNLGKNKPAFHKFQFCARNQGNFLHE